MQFTISRKPAIASPYIVVRQETNEIERATIVSYVEQNDH